MWDPAKAGATGTSGSDIWATLTSGGSLTMRELQGDGIDQHLAYVAGGDAYWYLTDHLNSIRAVLNSGGGVTASVAYDAYGNLTTAAAPGLYDWTGREFDVETGLQYNRARYYDPGTGRWISQDPMGFDAGDSNLYRYVADMPTCSADPSGELAEMLQGASRAELEVLTQGDVSLGVEGQEKSYTLGPRVGDNKVYFAFAVKITTPAGASIFDVKVKQEVFALDWVLKKQPFGADAMLKALIGVKEFAFLTNAANGGAPLPANDKAITDAYEKWKSGKLTAADLRDDSSYIYNNALQGRRPNEKKGETGLLPVDQFKVRKGLFEYLDTPGFPANPNIPGGAVSAADYDAVYLYRLFRVTVTIDGKNPVSKAFGFYVYATSNGETWTLRKANVYTFNADNLKFTGTGKTHP